MIEQVTVTGLDELKEKKDKNGKDFFWRVARMSGPQIGEIKTAVNIYHVNPPSDAPLKKMAIGDVVWARLSKGEKYWELEAWDIHPTQEQVDAANAAPAPQAEPQGVKDTQEPAPQPAAPAISDYEAHKEAIFHSKDSVSLAVAWLGSGVEPQDLREGAEFISGLLREIAARYKNPQPEKAPLPEGGGGQPPMPQEPPERLEDTPW